ncbi:MAG: putative glycoside hydrolase [Mobilitalea sp.]
MKNKRDMYIDYKRSYKKHRRVNKKAVLILLSILFVVAVGTVAYAIVNYKQQTAKQQENDNLNEVASNQNAEGQEELPQATIMPTASPIESPTIAPTLTEVPAPTDTIEEDTSVSAMTPGRTPAIVKGIYVSAPTAGIDRMQELIHLADTTEINAMVIDVKDDQGKISYLMDSAMAIEIGAVTNTITDMKELLKELKKKDIYLIARIVAFKDPLLAEQKQEFAVKNKDGTLYRDNNSECWVNPYRREVWDYLVEIAAQAAAIGFDEIQFDYIRFSTGKGMAKADFGEEAKTTSKEEIITEFTKYAYDKIKPLGVFVSADVYGAIISSSVDAGLVGQDYVKMAKYLDYICPMIYPSHFGEGNYGIEHPDLEPYEIIRKVLTASKDKLAQIPEGEHCAIVRPWLQDFTATWIKPHKTYGAEELRDQIKGVYSTEYEEWLVWNASCKYSTDGFMVEE